jgi:hypothetical protein
MRWSVGIEAEGDRVLSREEIVELADAVAPHSGVATGIGSHRYGARLIVMAGHRDEAIAKATGLFTAAARLAGLPAAPVVRTEAISEAEEALSEDALPEEALPEEALPDEALPGDARSDEALPGEALPGTGDAAEAGGPR